MFGGKEKRQLNAVFSFWAENETRTRDPNLGKVVLYQLSYFRNTNILKFYDYNLSIASAKVLQIFYSPNFFASFLIENIIFAFMHQLICYFFSISSCWRTDSSCTAL